MDKRKMELKIYSFIIFLFFTVGIFFMGFGIGEITTSFDYDKFITNKYYLNLTYEKIDKQTLGMVLIQFYYHKFTAISLFFFGLISVLLSGLYSYEHDFLKRKKTKKKKVKK